MSKFRQFLIDTAIQRNIIFHILHAAVSMSLSAAGESLALGFV